MGTLRINQGPLSGFVNAYVHLACCRPSVFQYYEGLFTATALLHPNANPATATEGLQLVGGRSTGRTTFISPDAARTTTELNRGDSVATRPPTTSLPMSLKLADLARVPLGLVKLVAAELLIVKLVTVELLAVTVAA